VRGAPDRCFAALYLPEYLIPSARELYPVYTATDQAAEALGASPPPGRDRWPATIGLCRESPVPAFPPGAGQAIYAAKLAETPDSAK
jgi:hypothetical protein